MNYEIDDIMNDIVMGIPRNELETVLSNENSTTIKNTKLLPCPFCGSKAEMLNYSESEWLVHCPKCDGMVERWRKTEEEAINQWNKRVDK